MEEVDQEKTTFITLKGTYCYKMMPFGFKNAGATYQRLVMKIFQDEIGKTVETYNDDMVVKSKAKAMHEEDSRSVFDTLWRNKLKLNTSKCSFAVSSGKFLRYSVTQRGIEANPDQIQAIQKVDRPSSRKEVQRLTGMLAALNRFLSRSSDKCRPMLLALKKKG